MLLLCLFDFAIENLAFNSSTHHQVNHGLKNLLECIASIKIDVKSLGNTQRTEHNVNINIIFSRPEVAF
jgi:hypothetical protein